MSDQSVEPHTKWPVVMLSHLSADRKCFGRRDDAVTSVAGRRPSDVYGEVARARWRRSRRPLPLARSAAAIRAARTAKSAVGSADDAPLSSNCSSATTKSDNPVADEGQEKTAADTVTNVFMSNGDANGDVASGEETSPAVNLFLPITKFYNNCVVTEHNFATSRSAKASAVLHQRDFDTDRVQFSPSKYANRKRKSPQQEAANRVKKTYDRTSYRTDKLNGRNTSFAFRNRSAPRSPSKRARRTNATCSKETSPAKEDSKQDDTETNVEDVGGCDDTLPVVPIDEKYASMSISAMYMTDSASEHLQQPKPDSSESLSNKPVVLTSHPAALSTSDSATTSTRNLKSRKRAEQTIFERFINALSLHKPRTSEKENVILAATDVSKAVEGDSVPNSVQDAENESKTVQQSASKTDNTQLGTTSEQLPETLVNDNDETIVNSCSPTTKTDTDHSSTLDSAQRNTAEIQADTAVEADLGTRKREDDDAVQNEASKRQNEERRTRGVKAMIHCREDSELLVTSRPVRKRQPSIYIDTGFYRSAKPGRKASLPAKSHGSCLLPPDFDSSQSKGSGAGRQSWKTILDGLDRTSAKTGPGRPKKTKRQYKRRKRTVVQDEVQWTIHKKLLLGGTMPKKPKSTSCAKFPRKRKLKSPPKSSTVDMSGDKLWTRSMTRIQRTASKRKSAEDTADDGLTLPAVGALKEKDEVLNVSIPTSSASNSAVPSTDDATLSLNVSSSQSPPPITKPDSPLEEKMKETFSSDTSKISLTTTTTTSMTVKECVEPVVKDDAAETASAISLQQKEAELKSETKMAAADVTSVDKSSISTDQSAINVAGSGSTSTTATNTDETKVDDESVEALMHLVKQLQDAVANEKLRKAKGALYLFH